MDKIYRVFYHELGHYVAMQLNKDYYSGTGTQEIKIYPCENAPYEYCGGAKPINPKGEMGGDGKPVPIQRLAECLARNLYGCIFQSYYLDNNLDICFDEKGHGREDLDFWSSNLTINKLQRLKGRIYELGIKHLDFLKLDNLLDDFISLEPEKYLVKIDERSFKVNLEILSIDCCLIIENHSKHYKNFVNEHQIIINEEISKI